VSDSFRHRSSPSVLKKFAEELRRIFEIDAHAAGAAPSDGENWAAGPALFSR